MKAEAEMNAEADKQAKERIDKLNHADGLIFQTEKQLKEFGDKLPADKKGPIEEALTKLKEAHKNQDVAAIDAATTELNTVFHAASEEMYKAGAQQQGQPNNPFTGQNGPFAGQEPFSGQQNGGGNPDEVTDVDFEEVK
jgi:molecular chaperone DnaK